MSFALKEKEPADTRNAVDEVNSLGLKKNEAVNGERRILEPSDKCTSFLSPQTEWLQTTYTPTILEARDTKSG